MSCDHDNIETILLLRHQEIDNIVTSLMDIEVEKYVSNFFI